jgi:hypothetical protein
MNESIKGLSNQLSNLQTSFNIQHGINQDSINDIQRNYPFINFDYNTNSI